MKEIVKSAELFVMQVEMDVYSLLKKVYYFKYADCCLLTHV